MNFLSSIKSARRGLIGEALSATSIPSLAAPTQFSAKAFSKASVDCCFLHIALIQKLDIDYRSFSKSRDETGDYSSSVNLDFTLQGTGEKDPRDDVSNAK